MRRSEERWRAVFENSGVGIALAGPDGILTAANRAYQEMLGYTEDELRKMSFLDVTYEEDRPANRALARELWSGNVKQIQYEKRYRRKDGRLIWVRNTVSLAPGTDTVPRFAMALVEDITERKRVEEQNRFQASLLSQVRNAVIALDPQGRITYWNQPAETLYQWKAEEAMGKNARELLVPPEARALAGEVMSNLERDGQWEGEFVAQRKDGTRIAVYTVNAVLRDDGGKLAGFVGVSTDITERKQAEEALRQSEDRYRDLVEHSQDLLCTHDLQGKLLSVNRAAVRALGYEPEELLQKSLPELLTPEVRTEFADYVAAIRRDGAAQGLMAILTRSGDRRIWEYHNTLRTEGVAEPIVRGVAHDVTERLLAERTVHSLLRISETLHSARDVETLMNSLIIEALKLTGSEIGWSGLATEQGMICTSCIQGSQVIPFQYCWPPEVG
ncbi:MAG TPA: PAS domain S-box protein, partial [Terriglobia bacterium]|nr:PAS domain S-box protein [Terriglobia bacterium]